MAISPKITIKKILPNLQENLNRFSLQMLPSRCYSSCRDEAEQTGSCQLDNRGPSGRICTRECDKQGRLDRIGAGGGRTAPQNSIVSQRTIKYISRGKQSAFNKYWPNNWIIIGAPQKINLDFFFTLHYTQNNSKWIHVFKVKRLYSVQGEKTQKRIFVTLEQVKISQLWQENTIYNF